MFFESSSIWMHTLPRGFTDAGHEVIISGPLTEQNISGLMAVYRPQLAITVGWGPEQTHAKARSLRHAAQSQGVPLVYWAVEDPAFLDTWSLPFVLSLQPDFVFTLCPESIGRYRQHGFKAAHLDFGFHPSVHCPVPVHHEYPWYHRSRGQRLSRCV